MKPFNLTKTLFAAVLALFAMHSAAFGQQLRGVSASVTLQPWQADGQNIHYSGGNVGIGTTSPSTKMQVNFSSGTSLTGNAAYGGIHLDQDRGNGGFVGITTSATSSGTKGGILFQGSGSFGTKIHFLTTDSYRAGMKQRMIIDHKGNVGIGVMSPAAKLDILADSGYEIKFTGATGNIWAEHAMFLLSNKTLHVGAGGTNSQMVLNEAGNLGIGVTTPGARLDVNGGVKVGNTISSPGYADHFIVRSDGGTAFEGGQIFTNSEKSSSKGIKVSASFSGSSPQLHIGEVNLGSPNTFTRNYLHLKNGNVGIGTTSPGKYKLAVEGVIGAREVVVTSDSWADFVFDDDYDLMPLRAVERYVEQHRHLPGLPSEADVLEDGVALGTMQATLLQKIEELTLYVIALKKENETLKERVDAMDAK